MSTVTQPRTWPFAVAMAVLAGALYARSLSANFVYDARSQVLIDTYIHQPGHLVDVLSLRVMSQDVLDNNRPFHLLVLIVDSIVWGKDPVGYHLTSILLHAIATGLLFAFIVHLLERLGTSQRTAMISAAIGALIFAFHPVNCEAIAEVSYREDPLSAVFVLIALVAATRFPGSTRRQSIRIGAIVVLGLFLAVGSKESGAAGGVILVIYWLMFRRKETIKPWLTLILVTGITSGSLLAARFILQPKDSVIFTSPPQYLDGSLWNTLRVLPRIWTFYLQHIAWPVGLCADYTPPSIAHISPAMGWSVLGSVAAVGLTLSIFSRGFALGFAIMVLGILPVSNLLPMYRPIADRYLYLPMIGVAIVMARAIAWNRPWKFIPPAIACVAMLGVLAMMTFQRQAVWHDSLSLWTDTLARNPKSVTAADNIGFALLDAHRPRDAVDAFLRCIQMTGQQSADPWAGFAIAAEAMGDRASADMGYQRAVALDNHYADPESLFRALNWERGYVDQLKPIADRNRR